MHSVTTKKCYEHTSRVVLDSRQPRSYSEALRGVEVASFGCRNHANNDSPENTPQPANTTGRDGWCSPCLRLGGHDRQRQLQVLAPKCAAELRQSAVTPALQPQHVDVTRSRDVTVAYNSVWPLPQTGLHSLFSPSTCPPSPPFLPLASKHLTSSTSSFILP